MNRRFGVVIPLRRWKTAFAGRWSASFLGPLAEAASAKAAPLGGERPASWVRVVERFRFEALAVGKLPLRPLRGAKVRIFRSFKLLGRLKREDGMPPVAPPPDRDQAAVAPRA